MSSSSEAKQELDFFDMEKQNQSNITNINNNNNNPAVVASSSTSQFQKLFERRMMSFHHDDQGNQSNINPLLLNTVISSDGGERLLSSQNNIKNSSFVPLTTPKYYCMSPLFLRSSAGAASGSNTPPATPSSPLTIFYNGTISVFDVPHDKAERIIMVAEKESSNVPQSLASVRPNLLENSSGVLDLPLQRKRSLQRFLEKRKERKKHIVSTTIFQTPQTGTVVIFRKMPIGSVADWQCRDVPKDAFRLFS